MTTEDLGSSASEEKRMTLLQRFPIRYRRPSHVPAQLIISGNRLRIRLFVRYAKSMLEIFPGTDLTYADIAESGIRSNWSGRYSFSWLADDGYERAQARARLRVLESKENPDDSETTPTPPAIRVTVEFVRYGSTLALSEYPHQRFFRVKLSRGVLFPAHVVSPPWRWYWGFFRSGQLEGLHLNWVPEFPGNVTLQREPDRKRYQQIAAHEIGHILGIGDAYAANYRFFFEAPGTSNYMMCHNRRVQPEEIERTLTAHYRRRMQYFPKKFRLGTFFTGLSRSFRLQFHAVSKKLS